MSGYISKSISSCRNIPSYWQSCWTDPAQARSGPSHIFNSGLPWVQGWRWSAAIRNTFGTAPPWPGPASQARNLSHVSTSPRPARQPKPSCLTGPWPARSPNPSLSLTPGRQHGPQPLTSIGQSLTLLGQAPHFHRQAPSLLLASPHLARPAQPISKYSLCLCFRRLRQWQLNATHAYCAGQSAAWIYQVLHLRSLPTDLTLSAIESHRMSKPLMDM